MTLWRVMWTTAQSFSFIPTVRVWESKPRWDNWGCIHTGNCDTHTVTRILFIVRIINVSWGFVTQTPFIFELPCYSIPSVNYYVLITRSNSTFLLLTDFCITVFSVRLRWSWGSVLAFSTQVRGFKPGRSRRIFRAKNSSARLPSEGK